MTNRYLQEILDDIKKKERESMISKLIKKGAMTVEAIADTHPLT